MFSGAGESGNRRRRDFLLLLCSFGLFFLFSMVSFQTQLFKPSRILSPLTSVEGKSKLLISPTPSILCDALPEIKSFSIAMLIISRSGLAQIPSEEYSHWASLMAGDSSLGPSDAPCSVESSTAHGESIFWMATTTLSDNSMTKLVIFLTQILRSSRSVSKPDHRLAPNYQNPAPASISDQTASLVSNRNLLYGQRLALTKGETEGKTLISQVGSSLGMGLLTLDPQRFLPQPISNSIGLTQNTSWPRFAYFNLLPKPNLLASRYFAEVGRRLQFHTVLTLMVSLDKYHLIILEEDTFSTNHRCNLVKKPTFQPSSLIERTLVCSLNPLLRNCSCTPTISLGIVFLKPVLLKVKSSISTSLGLSWNVTNHQSPKNFVELFSIRHSLACDKLLPGACFRSMDLPSNYLLSFLYLLLVRVLVVIFEFPNHEVDVCLNFVFEIL